MFGFLSCIFSGFAFAGLIITIRQQREDLELQRIELQRANKEAEDQTAQFKEQTQQLKEQIAISRINQNKDEFYRRLSLLKQQESDIVYRWQGKHHNSSVPKDMQVNGIEAVEKYYQNICESIRYDNNENWAKSHPCSCESFRVWMRSFFTMVNDIMEFYQDEESRRFHIRILINCTSLHERALLYYDHKNLQSASVNNAMNYLLKKEFINPTYFPK